MSSAVITPETVPFGECISELTPEAQADRHLAVLKAESHAELFAAAEKFNARQDRRHHPEGSFDNAGRWYPSSEESCECCSGLRSPSRAYPYSLMVHCRTAKHVAELHQVEQRDVKRVAKRLREIEELRDELQTREGQSDE